MSATGLLQISPGSPESYRPQTGICLPYKISPGQTSGPVAIAPGHLLLPPLRELFSSVREEEKEFLVGLILNEVRQGALEGLVLQAVAQASGLPVERIQKGWMFSGNIGEVARAALEEGLQGYDSSFLPLGTKRRRDPHRSILAKF